MSAPVQLPVKVKWLCAVHGKTNSVVELGSGRPHCLPCVAELAKAHLNPVIRVRP